MPVLIIIIYIFEYFYIIIPLAIIIFVFLKRNARDKRITAHAHFMSMAVSETDQLQANHQLNELAKNTNLTFTPGTLSTQSSLQGNYRGIPISVYDERRAIGDQFMEVTFFKAVLDANRVPPGLQVRPRDPSSLHSIPFGDPDLDQVFVIVGAAPAHTREFFARPAVKACFLELHALASSFFMENNTLTITYKRGLSAHQHLVREHIERLTHCAHEVNGTRLLEHVPQHFSPRADEIQQNESQNHW